MLDVEREREKEAKDRSSSTNWKGSRLKHSFSFSPFLEPNFPSFVRGKREINAFDKSKIIIDELKTFPFFQTIPEEKSETRFRQVDLFIDDTELFIDEEDAKMGGDDFFSLRRFKFSFLFSPKGKSSPREEFRSSGTKEKDSASWRSEWSKSTHAEKGRRYNDLGNESATRRCLG